MKDRTLKSLIEIEGLAMMGLIVEAMLEDCSEPPGWRRIVAIDREGNAYETKCLEPQAAKRNYMVLNAYIVRWSKSLRTGGD